MKPANFKMSGASLAKDKSDAIIFGLYEDQVKGKTLKLSAELQQLDKASKKLISSAIQFEKFTAKLESVIVIDTYNALDTKRIILVGLGAKKEMNDCQKIRKAAAAAVRKATSLKAEKIAIELFGQDSWLDEEEAARAITEVSLLAPYNYLRFKTTGDNKYKGIKDIKLVTSIKTKSLKDSVEKGILSAEGVYLARDLIISPPNEVNPGYLATLAKKIAKENSKNGLSVKVMGRKECEKLKMNAFLAVGRGSENEPQFIHFTYKPKGKANKKRKHIAFVGKGITFDTGGLSLKPSKAMDSMKYDMAGSAAVFGLMSVIAKIQPDVEVTAIVAAAENMPDGNAYRPGDIITAMNGKTIEILNTDAEGRVTLADAVHYACQQKPDHLIDIATLTGAVVVALGETYAGIMTNNQRTLETFMDSCEVAGEKVWQLPLDDDYEKGIHKSTIADMVNTGSGGQAGSQNGAVFVKQFIGDTPWIHMDIAGACWPDRWDTPLTPRDNPAGFGVLSFIRHLENQSV